MEAVLSNIPSKESVLAFIRDVFQAGPADKKRKEFEQLRRQSNIQLKTTEDYVDEILSALGLDEVAQLQARELFFRWSEVNNFLERNIWVSHSIPRHIIWLMATHVYAPGLGRHLAFWDSVQKTDPGMSGGRFWFLPSVMSESDVKLTMPVTQVLNWLLDSLSCSLDELAQVLSNSLTITGREKDTAADFRAIRKTLRNWHAATSTPGVNKILELFNSRLNLPFNGTFDWDDNQSLNDNFNRAKAFVNQKGLSAKVLSIETPIPEATVKELLENPQPGTAEKEYFCYHLTRRYHTPDTRTIRKRLLYARAFQATYFKLAGAIGVPKEAQKLPNPSINPAIQVVSIFQIAYNLTIDSCRKSEDERNEYELFIKSIEERYPLEAHTTFLSLNKLSGSLHSLANQLNKRLMWLGQDDAVEDELPMGCSKEQFAALYKRKSELLMSCQIDHDESHRLNTATKDGDLYQGINRTRNWPALNSVINSNTISLPVRRAAAWRMVDIASTDLEHAYGLVALLSQLLNDPDKRNRPTDAQDLADALFRRIKRTSTEKNLSPVIRQLEAKHELAKNHLKGSKAKFDQALDELRVKGFGTLRGEVARDALAVFASGLYRGFNSGACDQYTLSIINYGRLETPAPWYLPSTEELANKAKDYFWECLYQPYAGVPRLSLNGVQPSDA